MNPRHYRDMIIRAVGEPDGKMLGLIVEHVVDAERAKEILRANPTARCLASSSSM